MRPLLLLALCACNGPTTTDTGSTDSGNTDSGGTDSGGTDSGGSDTSEPPSLGFGIDAAGDHSCVHVSNGDLHCWGRSHVGQLGLATGDDLGDNELPTSSRVNVGAAVVDVALGNLHTCALTDDGDVKCWGLADLGQLGYGNTDEVGLTNAPSAVGTVQLPHPAVEIEAGGMFSCARLNNGDVTCWGQDFGGWLGQGSSVGNIGDTETPMNLPAIALGGSATRIAVGQLHACAVLEDKTLRCWGEGPGSGHGAAGVYTGDDETPASAGDPLGQQVDNVWAGGRVTCAQLTAGGLRCWGDGSDYELGRPGPTGQENLGVEEIVSDPTLGPTHDFGEPVIDMALGTHYSCALLESGAVKCWGQHWEGVLGRGQVGSVRVAVDAPDLALGGTATALAGQLLHNCALLGNNGDVTCWGEGNYGKLGTGDVADVGDDETPATSGTVSYR